MKQPTCRGRARDAIDPKLSLRVTHGTTEYGDGADAPRRHLCAKAAVSNCHLKEASMERTTTIGLDIAIHVFPAQGADAAGHVLFR